MSQLTVATIDMSQLLAGVATAGLPLSVTLGWRPATAFAVVDGMPRWALWAVPPPLPDPVYDDGTVTLYGGVDAGDVLPRLDIDDDAVLITDPPYGISHSSGRQGNAWWHGRQIHNDTTTDVRDDVLAWWQPRAAIVFASPRLPAPPGSTAHPLTWLKWPLGSGDLRIPFRPDTETIHVIGHPWDDGFARTSSALDYPPVQSTAKNGRRHQHEKPLPLMVELVAKTRGTVVDPFAGSATTLVAAKALGRRAIGIELSMDHALAAAERLADTPPPVYLPARKGDRLSTKPSQAGRRFHPRRACLPDGRPDDQRDPYTPPAQAAETTVISKPGPDTAPGDVSTPTLFGDL